jgi:hypothetical protein
MIWIPTSGAVVEVEVLKSVFVVTIGFDGSNRGKDSSSAEFSVSIFN